MTNVYSYFGIQDVHDLADRVLHGDASDLGSRAKMCTQVAQTVESIATELQQLSDQLFQNWTGVGADAAKAKMRLSMENSRDSHRGRVYQTRDGAGGVPILQRPEEDHSMPVIVPVPGDPPFPVVPVPVGSVNTGPFRQISRTSLEMISIDTASPTSRIRRSTVAGG